MTSFTQLQLSCFPPQQSQAINRCYNFRHLKLLYFRRKCLDLTLESRGVIDLECCQCFLPWNCMKHSGSSRGRVKPSAGVEGMH
ncbi:hypothetical protein L1987_01750 [Smallanthus sonchifolius]|uniref:Uncharacterized protein n=1 Tax=Smallanthus sonchifolius TaxID=185202 RepID=A0ACB9K5X8_9ASTR|nr:hypothetical protein L1987_01750 [Smallanthus sonchifolius]